MGAGQAAAAGAWGHTHSHPRVHTRVNPNAHSHRAGRSPPSLTPSFFPQKGAQGAWWGRGVGTGVTSPPDSQGGGCWATPAHGHPQSARGDRGQEEPRPGVTAAWLPGEVRKTFGFRSMVSGDTHRGPGFLSGCSTKRPHSPAGPQPALRGRPAPAMTLRDPAGRGGPGWTSQVPTNTPFSPGGLLSRPGHWRHLSPCPPL